MILYILLNRVHTNQAGDFGDLANTYRSRAQHLDTSCCGCPAERETDSGERFETRRRFFGNRRAAAGRNTAPLTFFSLRSAHLYSDVYPVTLATLSSSSQCVKGDGGRHLRSLTLLATMRARRAYDAHRALPPLPKVSSFREIHGPLGAALWRRVQRVCFRITVN